MVNIFAVMAVVFAVVGIVTLDTLSKSDPLLALLRFDIISHGTYPNLAGRE